MTPTEMFAQSRAEAEALIRQYAPARLQDAVIERLLPAIALAATRTPDAEIPVGASKFGGAPDVATGFEWPMWKPATFGQSTNVQSHGEAAPLSFVAQINLDEIAPFDIEHKLPSSGLLSFFYFMANEDQWPNGDLEQAGGWRVFHFDGNLSRAEVPEEARIERGLLTATITPSAVWSAPKHPYYINGEQWNDWPGEDFEAWMTINAVFEKDATHLMLGYPRDIQDDARLEVANRLERGTLHDWHLLLQMDTDDEIDWMWGDVGAMFYLMHRDDLANREWDKCWLIAQCG